MDKKEDSNENGDKHSSFQVKKLEESMAIGA